MSVWALILAHQHPALLGRLVRRLARIGIGSIIHVDARVEQAPFEHACGGGSFVTTRHVVHWGGFSVVEATLTLVRAGLEAGAGSRFLHISGDTYPIKPDHALLDALAPEADLISIHESGPEDPVYRRIAQTYVADSRLGFLRVHGDHDDRFVTPELMAQWAEVSRVYALKSAGRFPWRFASGANWWCLRRATLERCVRIIETNSDVVSWFKYSAVPDESLFHTIILNGGRVDQCRPCPVYTEWSRVPKPYTFERPEDAALLLRSELPLARKFSDRSGALLDLIEGTGGPAVVG